MPSNVIARKEQIAEVLQSMQRVVELEIEQGGNNAQLDIMASILTAEDIDDVFRAASAGTVSSKDYLSQPFFLRADGIQWKYSRIEGGFPYYVLLNIRDMQTGNDMIVDAGGYSVVGTLFAVQQRGIFEDSRYAVDGEACFQFVGKEAASGTVVLLMPFQHPGLKANGKAKK